MRPKFKTMNFYQFLKYQMGRGDDVGKFAREIYLLNLPKSLTSKRFWYERDMFLHGLTQYMPAFKQADADFLDCCTIGENLENRQSKENSQRARKSNDEWRERILSRNRK